MKKKYLKSAKIIIDDEACNLGTLLQQIRKEKGLSLLQMAEFADTDQSYIWKIEKGIKNPGIHQLQRLIKKGLGGKLEIIIWF